MTRCVGACIGDLRPAPREIEGRSIWVDLWNAMHPAKSARILAEIARHPEGVGIDDLDAVLADVVSRRTFAKRR